jgi:hypothetical protein
MFTVNFFDEVKQNSPNSGDQLLMENFHKNSGYLPERSDPFQP